MALGATDRDVLKRFIFQGSAPAILGAAVGAFAGFGVAKASATLLYGVSPYNTTAYAATIAILALVAIAASYIPARRAASINPASALRCE
jgi:ABC-type antimicrobial peptide transport system permease subunit